MTLTLDLPRPALDVLLPLPLQRPQAVLFLEPDPAPARRWLAMGQVAPALGQAVKDQLKGQGLSYRDELVQLAQSYQKKNLPAEASQIVTPMIDAISDGKFTADEAQAILVTAAGVGATAACAVASGGSLAPVCVAAGGLISGLLGNMLAPSPSQPDSTAWIGEEIQRLFVQGEQVRNKLEPQFYDTGLEQQFYDLVDAFYDKSGVSVVEYDTFSNIWISHVDPAKGTSSWLEKGAPRMAGGFYAAFTQFFQIFPAALLLDDQFNICMGKAVEPKVDINNPASWFTKKEDPFEKQNNNGIACTKLDNKWVIWFNDDYKHSRFFTWYDALKAALAKVGVELGRGEEQLYFNEDGSIRNNDYNWFMRTFYTSVFGIMQFKFQERLSALMAAAIAIKQKPILDALETVSQKMLDKYGLQCETDACKTIVQAKVKEIAKSMVVAASKGLDAADIDTRLKEAEQQIEAAVRTGSLADSVDDIKEQSRQEKGSVLKWVGGAAVLAGLIVGGKYAYEKWGQ